MAAVHPSQSAGAFDSSQLYRLIADTIPHLVWAARADGWIDFFNQRFQSYSGLDARQLASWGWKPVLHPEDLAPAMAAWTGALHTGEPLQIECRLRRADGSFCWHHISALPARGPDGRILRWFGTCTDVDQRTCALHKSEERFRSLTQLTADVFWEQDCEYRFTSFTESGHLRRSAHSPRALLGRRRWEIGYLNMEADDWTRHRALLEARQPFYEMELCRMQDGREFWVSTSGEPVFEGAAFKGYRGVARDITQRKRGEALLRLEHSVTRCLADSNSTAAGVGGVIRCICEAQDWACGRYFKADEAAGVLQFAQAWGIAEPGVEQFIAASAGLVYRRGEGLTGRVWQSGEPVWVSDVANDPRCTGPSNALATRIAAVRGGAFVFPLLAGTRILGVLTFASTEVRAPDERLLRAVQVIGSQVGQFLERKRSEEVLRESERRFQLFFDNAPGMAWIKDAALCYTYVNRAWEHTNKRRAADVLGKDDFQVFPSELARLVRTDDQEVLKEAQVVQKVHQVPQSLRDQSAGSALQHFITVKFPLADAAGKTGIAGIGVDMTERARAEELATRYATDVRRLLNRLVVAQESERRKLAHDLHDLIGQNLTALGIELGTLKAQLAAPLEALGEDTTPRLNAMAGLVDGTIDAIRGVMSELRPPALEEFGLLGALRSHAADFSARTGMQLAIDFPERELRLAPDTELALFRIVQEALTNAAKHSGGSRVQITLTRQAGRLRLCIADDGRGFSEAAAGARRDDRGGWGLPAMYERAQALGAALAIEFPGRGTRVVVSLPSSHAD